MTAERWLLSDMQTINKHGPVIDMADMVSVHVKHHLPCMQLEVSGEIRRDCIPSACSCAD